MDYSDGLQVCCRLVALRDGWHRTNKAPLDRDVNEQRSNMRTHRLAAA